MSPLNLLPYKTIATWSHPIGRSLACLQDRNSLLCLRASDLFQIDHGGDGSQGEEPPVGVLHAVKTDADGKQRASLDTLALTKDLASYPLGFDRRSKESLRLSWRTRAERTLSIVEI
ncbi:hypothetical protein BJV78DRAFT_1156228 [Lactifluus subvellereus]|nr:hypothetical protein BJV78DRAFT_1156228 [Lactifluus subvellereus]